MISVDQIQSREMLEPVARALGDLLSNVVFVGGSTTALLITDALTRESVRFTHDIDLIVNAAGYAEWQHFQQALRQRGFKESMDDDVICRMRLGALTVDFMPDDEEILGFTNRWYRDAIANAQRCVLAKDLSINVLAPEYFIATKLEAWLGRGNNDPLSSTES